MPASLHRNPVVWWAVAVVSYTLALGIGPLLNPDAPIHADSPDFLRVVDLLAGQFRGTEVPFRIEYPVYPYLAWALRSFTPDTLFAARLASFLPALLTPAVVMLIVWQLEGGVVASVAGGIFTASMPQLVAHSAVPLYDSLFIFMTAASIASILWALRDPGPRRIVVAALVCGLAAATRGPGAFFVAVLALPLLAAQRLSRGNRVSLAILSVGISLVTLYAARYPLQVLSSNLVDANRICLKQLILDGIRYSGGAASRDVQEFSLNARDCTTMDSEGASICALSWPAFLDSHGRDWLKMAAKNWKRTALELPGVLTPFAFLFFPLAVGLFGSLGNKPGRTSQWVLGLMLVPFLVVVPAIQWQDRYFFPLYVPLCAVAGLGIEFMGTALERGGRLIGTALVVAVMLFGIETSVRASARDASEQNYRAACQWLRESGRVARTSLVMARDPGLYPYLPGEELPMPIASTTNTLCFARAHGVQAIVDGPLERSHNPAFSIPAPAAHTFGEGENRVDVFWVSELPASIP